MPLLRWDSTFNCTVRWRVISSYLLLIELTVLRLPWGHGNLSSGWNWVSASLSDLSVAHNLLKMKLWQLLNSLVFKHIGNVLEHLNDMETILLELDRQGDKLSDEKQRDCLLGTLTDFLIAIKVLADASNMEYDQVVSFVRAEMDGRIYLEFSTINQTASIQIGSVYPHMTEKKSKVTFLKQSRGPRTVRIWHCEKLSHIRFECRWKKQSKPHEDYHKWSSNQYRNNNFRAKEWDYSGRNWSKPNPNGQNTEPRVLVAITQAKISVREHDTTKWLGCGASHVLVQD